MEGRLKYEIPEYKQKYVCFAACFVNALAHFNTGMGHLRELELQVALKSLALPYDFTLLPKLALVGIREFGLDAKLYQNSEKLLDFDQAKKEFDKGGMTTFWRIKHASEDGIIVEDENITKDNYSSIKKEYEDTLKEAQGVGLKLEIVRPSPELLMKDLQEGRLSIWTVMMGNVGHSSLLRGYEAKKREFYFFDPVKGNVTIGATKVADYLRTPSEPVYAGLSLKPRSVKQSESNINSKVLSANKLAEYRIALLACKTCHVSRSHLCQYQ